MREWICSFTRFIYFGFSVCSHLSMYALLRLRNVDKATAAFRVRKHWLEHVPAHMGLHLHSSGNPCNDPCLYVANHISYLDPVLVFMKAHVSVVAKSEIRYWPLIGQAASIAGTIFVRRNNKLSRRATAESIRHALASGQSILVFPEGTTTIGQSTLPFRPKSFQAAMLANVPVQPIAIMYKDANIPFVGNDTFIPHFFRMFRSASISGHIRFGPLLTGHDAAEKSRDWIEEQISQNHHALTMP